ncbi:MAG TPA: flavodoxin [bacterium]|nr:flavodoxin [bacterium]
MKTMIVYQSMHGCTEKCAAKLQAVLPGGADVVNLKETKKADPQQYDAVIIGGSIHAGRIQGGIKRFCAAHRETLLEKKLGLFLCCMEEEQAQKQFDENFPEPLRKHAKAQGIFGGEFDFERMNFIARTIVKKVSGMTESVSKISEEAIRKFVEDLK